MYLDYCTDTMESIIRYYTLMCTIYMYVHVCSVTLRHFCKNYITVLLAIV